MMMQFVVAYTISKEVYHKQISAFSREDAEQVIKHNLPWAKNIRAVPAQPN
jgi:hypothetical protein